MSDRRRVIIIVISVLIGSFLSYLLFKFRRGGEALTSQDMMSLGTIFVISLGIILGIGYVFIWNKKNPLK
jgi:hypothetical protein